jgi:PGF-pre-PGF domain-containing protein
MPDTFDLNISSSNDHYAVSLDKNTVSLGPGAISVNTTLYEIPPRVTMNVETIKLNVRGDEPGVCRVKVEANSSDTTVKDSVETWTIVQGENGSVAKINSTIMDSALIDSSIIDSTVTNSAINNSIISASTITDSIIKNSTVIGTSLKDVIVEDAMVTDGNISRGNITIYSSPGIPFVIHKEIPISELVVGADHFDSNLVGLTYLRSLKSLTVDGANSDTGFDVNAKDDYSAGSLSVQRSIIPPFGFEECPNTVEGYVAVEVSDNVAQSTDVVAIKVFYDPAKVVELNFNESSLTLLRYNESADQDPWEPVPDQWLNLEAHYVEGNLSRYSVFALVGQPPALEPLGPGLAVVTGGGRVPNPWEIAILIASPGINFFHFEWLGLDILSVATDLKNVAMNAKVGLKRTDKPVEIPDCPGSVYGYYDISTNLESANLDSVTINFRVSKVWTVFNDLSVESVKLYRYTTSWEELKTSKFTEDNDYIYFSAESPDLSLFAIAGKKKAAEIEPPTRPTIPTPTPSAPAPSPLATPHASPGPSPFPVVPMVVVIAILVVVLIVAVIYMVRRRS